MKSTPDPTPPAGGNTGSELVDFEQGWDKPESVSPPAADPHADAVSALHRAQKRDWLRAILADARYHGLSDCYEKTMAAIDAIYAPLVAENAALKSQIIAKNAPVIEAVNKELTDLRARVERMQIAYNELGNAHDTLIDTNIEQRQQLATAQADLAEERARLDWFTSERANHNRPPLVAIVVKKDYDRHSTEWVNGDDDPRKCIDAARAQEEKL